MLCSFNNRIHNQSEIAKVDTTNQQFRIADFSQDQPVSQIKSNRSLNSVELFPGRK